MTTIKRRMITKKEASKETLEYQRLPIKILIQK